MNFDLNVGHNHPAPANKKYSMLLETSGKLMRNGVFYELQG